MNKFQRIVSVEDEDLIAILLTAGARLDPGDEFSNIVGDREIRSAHFRERTETGESVQDFKGIFMREPDPLKNEWHQKNPNHEFAVAWSAIHNRKWVHVQVRDRTKTALIRRGSSVCLIGGGLTRSQEDKLLQKIGV